MGNLQLPPTGRRQSGIRVLDEGPVSVYVRLNVLDDKAGAYTFSIEVELLEFVYTERHIASILRDVEITTLNDFLSELGAGHQATTWGKESWTGYANHSDARTYIRDNVLEYVDRFANDYLAANPR